MDHAEGESLAVLFARGDRLPIGVALRITLDACAALSAIHARKDEEGRPLGLVHREVSPEKILVGIDGVARVTGSGTPGCTRTRASFRPSELGYMASEFLMAGASTPSSDVFALGVVLWEALAGRRLFEGATERDVIRLIVVATIPRLRSLNPNVSPELDDVISRALAQSPSDRIQSTEDFGRLLEAASHGLVAPRSDVSKWISRSNDACRSGARAVIGSKAAALHAAKPSRDEMPETRAKSSGFLLAAGVAFFLGIMASTAAFAYLGSVADIAAATVPGR